MKFILLASAAILSVFFHYGFYQWLASDQNLLDTLRILTQDWLLLITFIDACTFSLLAIIWFWKDLQKTTTSYLKRIIWLGLTIIMGCPPFLVYLALKKSKT